MGPMDPWAWAQNLPGLCISITAFRSMPTSTAMPLRHRTRLGKLLPAN